MLSLLSLLACPKAPLPVPTPEPEIRLVSGPWDGASALALSALGLGAGPRGGAGPHSGAGVAAPAILLAAFVSQQTLWFTTSLDSGRGWKMPVGLAQGVSTGESAQGRPEILLSLGQTSVLTIVDGAPTLMRRDIAGWSQVSLEAGAQSAAMDGLVWESSALVVWTDPRGPSLRLWWEGHVEVLAQGPGLNLCARPALGVVDGRPSVAWLQDGLQQITLDQELEWQAADPVPMDSASSRGCDGPVFAGERLVRSDGGALMVGELPLDIGLEGAWRAAQPRGERVWLEQDGSQERVFVEGLPLLTGPSGSLEIWEPVQVGAELWVPFSSSGVLTLVAYRAALEV